jgi:tRNA-splicing ligase RtcB (3'-phosphate/5'-hydroxy nucleic acid ligase)
MSYATLDQHITEHGGGKPIKAWVRGVPLEDVARRQLENISMLPIVYKHVAAMPDVHLGIGATVGSVIPTRGAIIPAAVGVDIGCGMCAVRTSLTAEDLPENLRHIRHLIERAVPHGRSRHGGKGDNGAWNKRDVPTRVDKVWRGLNHEFKQICDKMPILERTNNRNHLGTLGSGNHFVEVCLDEDGRVWVMLHSGSRGVGNKIGSTYIRLAKKDMKRHLSNLPDEDLAYFTEGSEHFEDYVRAVGWAQRFARKNRELMLDAVLGALRKSKELPSFQMDKAAVNCHHNYVQKEEHFGESVFVTRKGAVSARQGELGIIPGSMGARSFIVEGRGNAESFHSCSHGAGRAMSRGEAKRRFTVADHEKATAHVECRKDANVIDETPMAYKDIDRVMAAQDDLVAIKHTLSQVICVKG